MWITPLAGSLTNTHELVTDIKRQDFLNFTGATASLHSFCKEFQNLLSLAYQVSIRQAFFRKLTLMQNVVQSLVLLFSELETLFSS